jgi:drug/metabolite transporter (DMT)-like permease
MLFSHFMCLIASIPFIFVYPPVLTAGNVLIITYMGIFQLGIASALFAYGIKRVPAVQAMLTSAIEPVLNPVWVLLAIGERPVFSVIAGGAIIISAVVFSSTVTTLRHRN